MNGLVYSLNHSMRINSFVIPDWVDNATIIKPKGLFAMDLIPAANMSRPITNIHILISLVNIGKHGGWWMLMTVQTLASCWLPAGGPGRIIQRYTGILLSVVMRMQGPLLTASPFNARGRAKATAVGALSAVERWEGWSGTLVK